MVRKLTEVTQAGPLVAPAAAPKAMLVTSRRVERIGFLLVALSAIVWSFGGAIARFVEAGDSWILVFWRSLWASAFLLAFMLWRDGIRGTLQLFRSMRLPSFAAALCF